MRDLDDVVNLYQDRSALFGPNLERMRMVRDAYNGDTPIPLPELDRQEQSFTANLLNVGLDQMAERVASTMPNVYCPPEKPGQDKSEEFARIRRQAILGWWDQNKMRLKMRQRARYLLGYGSAPVVITPNSKWQMPEWHVRDPLSCLPAPASDPNDLTPEDVIFTYTRSWGWLWSHEQWRPELVRLQRPDRVRHDSAFTVLEYHDSEMSFTAVLADNSPMRSTKLYQDSAHGTAAYPNPGGLSGGWSATDAGLLTPTHSVRGYIGTAKAVVLEEGPNKTGMCNVVIPGRINLDRRMGQFDGVLGMLMMQSRLMALELHAVERGIFPDTYLVGRANSAIPKFLAGPYDGRTGKVNIVQDGDPLQLATNPGFQTLPAIDRLERNARISSGTPAEFGGESGTNIRTGKRGDAVLSAVVDFPQQEAQEILAEALREENVRAIACDKAYFGDSPKSFYSNWAGARGQVDYTPNKHFTSHHNTVVYSMPGADANGTVIGLAQRVGAELLSVKSAMELDPMVEDAAKEHAQRVSEQIEAAVLAGFQQQVSQGQVPLEDSAWVLEQVANHKMSLAEAILAAQRRAQERQAAVATAEPGAPEAPVDPTAPEAQPGLSLPGMGAEAGTVQETRRTDLQLEEALGMLSGSAGGGRAF